MADPETPQQPIISAENDADADDADTGSADTGSTDIGSTGEITSTENHSEPDDAEPAQKPPRKWMRFIVMLSVPAALIGGAYWYWDSLQGKASTDNAYVQQDKVSISALVGGNIVEVYVKEGDVVKEGQLLFRIDPEPYRLEIKQANATIASAQANVVTLSNNADLSGAGIAAARESLSYAQSKFSRVKALWDRGFSTKADYEAAQHAVAQAQEELKLAQAQQQAARAQLATGPEVPGENPQIAIAKAQRDTAELALKRTEIRAPKAGIVTQASRLQIGQQAVAGLPILTLVATQGTYIEANFKETDLANMREGQRAEIRFDAYPDITLRGHVASIGAGTGSEFSVLPAQNATGNWVKVTQRVPVRIAIDGKSPRRLIAGLSSEVTVFTDSNTSK